MTTEEDIRRIFERVGFGHMPTSGKSAERVNEEIALWGTEPTDWDDFGHAKTEPSSAR